MPKFKVTIIWCFQFVLFVNSRQFEYLRVIKAGFIKGFLALDDEKNVDKYENILKRAFNVLNLNKKQRRGCFSRFTLLYEYSLEEVGTLEKTVESPEN